MPRSEYFMQSMLTFLKYTSCDVHGHRKALYLCECGNYTDTRVDCVKSGAVISCGCYHKKIASTHGLTGNPILQLWYNIKDRCYNKDAMYYKDYGDRGIAMFDGWINDPKAFVDWCINNGYEKGLEIDRINNNGNYEPSNCRFTTGKINCNNRRSNINICYNNRTQTLKQWCDELSFNYKLVYKRIKSGLSFEDAISLPSLQRKIDFNGQSKLLKEWSKEIGINYSTLRKRIKHGWSVKDALTVPSRIKINLCRAASTSE